MRTFRPDPVTETSSWADGGVARPTPAMPVGTPAPPGPVLPITSRDWPGGALGFRIGYAPQRPKSGDPRGDGPKPLKDNPLLDLKGGAVNGLGARWAWLDASLAFGAVAFKRQLAYRFANWSGLFTNVFFLLFRTYALMACYEFRDEIAGYDVGQVTTYVTVTQALLMVSPQWGRIGIAESVRTGQVAMDLIRPVPYVAVQLSQRLGISAYYVLVRAIPVGAVGALFGFLKPPADPWALLPFLISIALAAALGNLILILVELSSFWFGSERGVRFLVSGFANLFSGLLLPIAFFPEWARRISAFLPFEHSLYTPTRIYIGEVSGSVWTAIGAQLVWLLLLLILTEWMFRRGTKVLIIQGG